MVDEALLCDLQRFAQRQGETTSSVIREALASYVTSRYELEPPENPLLAMIGPGGSDEAMDLANGGDEELLRRDVDLVHGWSIERDVQAITVFTAATAHRFPAP